jgi:hypothetical protein
LAKRVEAWQKRLGPLGLQQKRIECVTLTDEVPDNDTAVAGVQPGGNYDSVRFFFAHEFLEETDDRGLDEVILHEWLHVAMRDLDRAIDAAAYELSAGARYQWNERVHHEREALVDRLARQIYALYTTNS